MTAVRDVPVGEGRREELRRGEKGKERKNEGRGKGEEEGRRDGGRENIYHNDNTGFSLYGKVGDDRAMSISQAPLCKGIIIPL